MSRFKKLKPSVPKRYLLFIAACAWTFAGLMLWARGAKIVIHENFPLEWSIAIGICWGVLFYLLIFARISLKHSRRIFRIVLEKPCAFSFFSFKSYIMMLVMISAGVFLRLSGAVDLVIIGVFYMIMGFPLALSSLRFWYYGFKYKKFTEKFKEDAEVKLPVLPRWQRWVRNLLSFGLVIAVLVVVFINWRIASYARPYIYESINDLPFNKVGLVPGTSNKVSSGHTNLFFLYRIEAAAALYKAGKISIIIVSGDNRTEDYNEPLLMKKELIKLGVPDSCIIADYAGRRTFDSVIRAWKIFGQKNFTFISQHFQNERAVFIAHKNGIEAVAFDAKDVSSYSGFKTKTRELFARVKVFLDEYILNQQPEIMGDPEPIK
jgi:SanA protein